MKNVNKNIKISVKRERTTGNLYRSSEKHIDPQNLYRSNDMYIDLYRSTIRLYTFTDLYRYEGKLYRKPKKYGDLYRLIKSIGITKLQKIIINEILNKGFIRKNIKISDKKIYSYENDIKIIVDTINSILNENEETKGLYSITEHKYSYYLEKN